MDLIHDEPIFTPPRKYSAAEYAVLDEKCADLIKHGMIEQCPPSDTKYASAPTMPAKMDADGNFTDRRLCIDFKAVNTCVRLDPYRMPAREFVPRFGRSYNIL